MTPRWSFGLSKRCVALRIVSDYVDFDIDGGGVKNGGGEYKVSPALSRYD